MWTSVPLVPPAMSTLHQDTTVAPATTYDYRVRAVGVAGPGPWSATATATSPSSAKSMKVTSISLSGNVRGGKASITGNVYVRDAVGQAVASASVTARWTLPNGSRTTSTAQTDSAGRSRFTESGARGAYTLTVTDVAKAGYVFDAAGSVLSRSITK